MSGHVGQVVAVVDDDPRILESLQDLLESAGYEARLHPSGGSLLAGGLSNIDCLITDIGMPSMDGIELRARVKRLRADLPVFLISGRDDLSQDEQESATFFRKPFDGKVLLAAIARVLHRATP
jgi:FixJ family two-component response regulator